MSERRHYPRTPWINAVHTLTLAQYKFHLSRTRKNGKITIAVAKDSPTSPSQVRCIKPSRPGWSEFVDAAERLLDLAMWDPANARVNRTNPSTTWNKNKRAYQTMSADIDIIASMLPQLITPVSGTSLRKLMLEARQNGTSNVRAVNARTNRYTEIMKALKAVRTVLDPLVERMQDARHMKGFSKEEVQTLASNISLMAQAAYTTQRQCRTMVEPRKIEDTRTITTPTTKYADSNMDVEWEESLIIEKSVTPPLPQDPEYPGPLCYPGTSILTAAYLRFCKADADLIAQSEATGIRLGYVIADELTTQGTPLSPSEQIIAEQQEHNEPAWAEVKAAINAGKPERAIAPKGFMVVPDE